MVIVNRPLIVDHAVMELSELNNVFCL